MMEFDPKPYYQLQERLASQVSHQDQLPTQIRYIAGTDVAYQEEANKMVGAFVVLDAHSLEKVAEAHHIMPISFPYVPGLFSFREIPSLLQAYQKLSVKPDLIICDGHGIAHPKGLGMASHLGLELDVPTIGCAKSRLLGTYEEVGLNKGSDSPLIYQGNVVGTVLRTRTGIKPLFVSIGHRVSLNTAKEWVLSMCPNYRLPETTRQADSLVNSIRKAI